MRLISVFAFISALAASAVADRAGEFDYYVLALSWNAGWCEYEGIDKGAKSCDPQYDYGFRLHGLWPQYIEGWPQFCSSPHKNPSRGETNRQAALFGSSGSAWHQWNKHGRCSGFSHQEYYQKSQELFDGFVQPDILLDLPLRVTLDENVIEAAISEVNPQLSDQNMSVVCKKGLFTEIRICLDRDFQPQTCTGKLTRDCQSSVEVAPMR